MLVDFTSSICCFQWGNIAIPLDVSPLRLRHYIYTSYYPTVSRSDNLNVDDPVDSPMLNFIIRQPHDKLRP